jgi:hypothetical protein
VQVFSGQYLVDFYAIHGAKNRKKKDNGIAKAQKQNNQTSLLCMKRKYPRMRINISLEVQHECRCDG